MTTNTAADAAREAHRQPGGQFGNQPKHENTSIVLGVQPDSPERRRALNTIGIGTRAGSDWERRASAEADTRALMAVADIPERMGVTRYRAIAAAIGKQERFDDCLVAGLRTKELIEAEQHDPSVLAGILQALPPAMKDRTLALAENGHDAKSLTAYGVPLAQRFTLDELEGTSTKPSVLKAMFTATGGADLSVLEALDKAGFRKVQDVLDMKAAIQSDKPEDLIRARSIVDPQKAAAYWKATGYRRGLNADELALAGGEG